MPEIALLIGFHLLPHPDSSSFLFLLQVLSKPLASGFWSQGGLVRVIVRNLLEIKDHVFVIISSTETGTTPGTG